MCCLRYLRLSVAPSGTLDSALNSLSIHSLMLQLWDMHLSQACCHSTLLRDEVELFHSIAFYNVTEWVKIITIKRDCVHELLCIAHSDNYVS